MLRFVEKLRRTPRDIDVGGNGQKEWKAFSSFTKSPLFHPCDRSIRCVSVEACWRGSKVYIGKRLKLVPDSGIFSGEKSLREASGNPDYYWIGKGTLTPFRDLARAMIFVPAYWLFVCNVVKNSKIVEDMVRDAFLDDRGICNSSEDDGAFCRAKVLSEVLNSYILGYSHSAESFVLTPQEIRDRREAR